MQYPHWLMVAGAVLVVVGFIGFALHKNNAEQVENNLKQEAPPPEEPAECRDLLTKGLTEFARNGSICRRRKKNERAEYARSDAITAGRHADQRC